METDLIICLNKAYGKKKNYLEYFHKNGKWQIYFDGILLEENKDYWLLDLKNLKGLLYKEILKEDDIFKVVDRPILVINFLSEKLKDYFAVARQLEVMELNSNYFCGYLEENFNMLFDLFYDLNKFRLLLEDSNVSLLELQEISDKCQDICIYYQLAFYYLGKLYCKFNNIEKIKEILRNTIGCLHFLLKSEWEKELYHKNLEFSYKDEIQVEKYIQQDIYLSDVELKEIVHKFYKKFQIFMEECFGESKYEKLYFLVILKSLFWGTVRDLRDIYELFEDINGMDEEKFLISVFEFIKYGYLKKNEIKRGKYKDKTNSLRQAVSRFKRKICQGECSENFKELFYFFKKLLAVQDQAFSIRPEVLCSSSS